MIAMNVGEETSEWRRDVREGPEIVDADVGELWIDFSLALECAYLNAKRLRILLTCNVAIEG